MLARDTLEHPRDEASGMQPNAGRVGCASSRWRCGRLRLLDAVDLEPDQLVGRDLSMEGLGAAGKVRRDAVVLKPYQFIRAGRLVTQGPELTNVVGGDPLDVGAALIVELDGR